MVIKVGEREIVCQAPVLAGGVSSQIFEARMLHAICVLKMLDYICKIACFKSFYTTDSHVHNVMVKYYRH